ncbi:hypothetical protein FDC50_10230 [Clostridium botulinum]|nr:hypothetical protein KU41_17375 [Clostridium botulinum]MBY6804335.1 hypothetical protein [Clostridium botulinum]MBY6813298.1 hypothetical protein [Clostridium botulinum]MBY6821968.1 hypothetical protein [Clostridium botulinum]NFJ49909.1 hypothetical protein [Clostridium botulinum]
MKLKDLRCVLSSQMVDINLDFLDTRTFVQEDYSEDNEYLGQDESESMWDLYGEKEVEQIYAEDSERINIDLGGEVNE